SRTFLPILSTRESVSPFGHGIAAKISLISFGSARNSEFAFFAALIPKQVARTTQNKLQVFTTVILLGIPIKSPRQAAHAVLNLAFAQIRKAKNEFAFRTIAGIINRSAENPHSYGGGPFYYLFIFKSCRKPRNQMHTGIFAQNLRAVTKIVAQSFNQ